VAGIVPPCSLLLLAIGYWLLVVGYCLLPPLFGKMEQPIANGE
jgi:hypothetical protein